jgi:hypothetical protein
MFHSSGARVKVTLDGDGCVLMHIKDSEGLVTSADISDIAALCAHIGASHSAPLLRDGSSTMSLEASASVTFSKDGVPITQSEGLALIKSGLFHATTSKVLS